MLVLTRHLDEKIVVFKDGGDYEDIVEITIVKIGHDRVRLGFTANRNIKVVRKELLVKPSD